jgi:golgi phosphoprotein 3
VEVVDDRQTGETILDEALRMMKGQEHDKISINSWVDLLSGEFSTAGHPTSQLSR